MLEPQLLPCRLERVDQGELMPSTFLAAISSFSLPLCVVDIAAILNCYSESEASSIL